VTAQLSAALHPLSRVPGVRQPKRNAAMSALPAKPVTNTGMHERPSLFARLTKTPRDAVRTAVAVAAQPATDVLGDTLRAIRLKDPVFLDASLSAPFGIAIRPGEDAGTPLAHLRNLSVFHLIIEGSCRIEIETGQHHAVSAGDILVLPFGSAHRLWSGDDTQEMDAVRDLMRPGAVDGVWTLDHGGGGTTTRILSGFIDASEFARAPVWTSLPSLLVDRTRDRTSALIANAVCGILPLADAATPTTAFTLERLMELLLVQVVRRHAQRLSPSSMGWLAALNDPIVGRALQAIHCNASRRWTVYDLAREAGTSRSVLSERFSAMVGQPPIEYLASFRIQVAAERLRKTDDCLAAVAADSGYESQAAFHRAFKRIAGVAPGRWRETGSAEDGHLR
jgi:AraC family transcriptional regulator, alkane utilization regulator